MIDFPPVIAALLEAEGPGGRIDPDDPGGLTVFGITMTYEHDWSGWPVVKKLMEDGISPSQWRKNDELMFQVLNYYEALWMRLHLHLITTEELQGCIMGGVVNQGFKVVGWLQEILGAKVDQDLGPVTASLIRNWEAAGRGRALFLELALKRIDYYSHTAKSKYLRGLILRVTQGGA